ncbi:MAG: 2OG-Fe(II) oxygenase [Gammaproteobacteria bacterium]|nr:2OG-Fe(II) oxygenase [Gammaproteobacteria bacterium]
MSKDNKTLLEDFYVVAKEPGAEHPALPTWAGNIANPIQLSLNHSAQIERIDIDEVPGAFQLLNVLSMDECQRFIEITESLGYLKDAAVSLPRSVRHNDNITWVVDEETDSIVWNRCKHLFTDENKIFDDKKPLGINARFRFYRYQTGDFFKTHTDGSWPGSRVINGELIADAYPDRWSQMTFLIFLTDDFEGGGTQFVVNKNHPEDSVHSMDDAKTVSLRTPAGGVLCFPHGTHRLHRLHSSEPITAGEKYIIRSDVLYELG